MHASSLLLTDVMTFLDGVMDWYYNKSLKQHCAEIGIFAKYGQLYMITLLMITS